MSILIVIMNIYEFIQNLGIEVLVEIGCNVGEDTRRFRSMHPNARIVCFEPDPRNINSLNQNGVRSIVELYPYAVSNQNGYMKFHLSTGNVHAIDSNPIFKDVDDWTLSSSLKKPTGHLTEHVWITFPNSVDVQTIRLDDFEPLKNTIIDIMWVDVQGAEDLVFSGGKEALKRTRYVYTEYSNVELYENQLNLTDLLKLFGDSWELVHDFGGDVLLRNKEL
jgi:FkbM family methyltransferase